MQQKPNNFSMQDAMHLANTPAGQQLLSLLQQSNPDVLGKAKQQAAAGEYTQLAKTLESLMASEEVKKLLTQLGG